MQVFGLTLSPEWLGVMFTVIGISAASVFALIQYRTGFPRRNRLKPGLEILSLMPSDIASLDQIPSLQASLQSSNSFMVPHLRI